MSTAFFETLAGAVGFVVLFDVLGARVSKRFGFSYGALAIPTWIVFLLLGLFAQATLLDARAVVLVAAAAALTDALAGAFLVPLIGPPRSAMTRAQLVLGSLVGVVSEVAIAFVGATWLFYGIMVYASHRR